MRIKITIILLLFFSVFLSFYNDAKAACAGTSCSPCSGNCGTQTCTYSQSYTSNSCGGVQGSCAIYRCIDYNSPCYGETCNGDPNAIYWNPEGYNTTVCSNVCDDFCTDNTSCVYESAEILCSCNPNPTPTPEGNNNDGDNNPTAEPTQNISLITGSIHTDIDAALSGSYCRQDTESPIYLPGLTLSASGNTGTHQAYFSVINTNDYSINTTYSGSNYVVTLDLSNQVGTNYVCSCPAASDPNNPYVCMYTGVGSPSNNVNFYLAEYNLSNPSWFQVFGGNLFGRNNIVSNVPYEFCLADANCQEALLVPPVGSSNEMFSGFPISNIGNSASLVSSDVTAVQHSYFHLPERASNVNSYGVSTDLLQLSYDYFYSLAENSIHQIGDGEDLEPLLTDWTNSAWWSNSDVNYVKVNGNVNIDETQGFNIASGEQLVVFVDGNLTIDDSNTNDTNRKITSVSNGGFLAFFASGDIIITADVGYELDPSAPSVPTVSNANSNVEGVFVAQGNLTIQSKNAIGEVPPDRKFIGSGTFVGWNNVNLDRTFNDGSFGPILNNNQAIDNFIYRPDLLSNWPTKLKASISNWREVDPQLINQ